MLSVIERYEPRIRVNKISIIADPDANTYRITLIIEIPVFKQETSLEGELNIKTQSFIFLSTSRNT